MQYGSAVLDGLSAQPLLGHGVINLLDVCAAQSLQLDSADLRLDVILYTSLIVEVCCRFDLIGGKGIEPFVKPLRDCRFCGVRYVPRSISRRMAVICLRTAACVSP